MAAKAALLEGVLPDQALLDKKLMIAKQLLKKNIPVKKIRAIYAFLNNYVRLEDPELNHNFTQQIDHLTKNNHQLGIIEYLQQEAKQEGLQTSRTEERKRLTIALIKKNAFSITEIASLMGVSTYYVNKLRKQLQSN